MNVSPDIFLTPSRHCMDTLSIQTPVLSSAYMYVYVYMHCMYVGHVYKHVLCVCVCVCQQTGMHENICIGVYMELCIYVE